MAGTILHYVLHLQNTKLVGTPLFCIEIVNSPRPASYYSSYMRLNTLGRKAGANVWEIWCFLKNDVGSDSVLIGQKNG